MRISVAILTIFSLHFVQGIHDFNFTQILAQPSLGIFLYRELYYTVHLNIKKQFVNQWRTCLNIVC